MQCNVSSAVISSESSKQVRGWSVGYLMIICQLNVLFSIEWEELRGNVIPRTKYHTRKAYTGRESKASHILELGARWRWVRMELNGDYVRWIARDWGSGCGLVKCTIPVFIWGTEENQDSRYPQSRAGTEKPRSRSSQYKYKKTRGEICDVFSGGRQLRKCERRFLFGSYIN